MRKCRTGYPSCAVRTTLNYLNFFLSISAALRRFRRSTAAIRARIAPSDGLIAPARVLRPGTLGPTSYG